MGEGARLRLPKTLDENPDVEIQGIPFTLTQTEWLFVIIAAGVGFMAGQIVGSGILSIVLVFALPFGAAQFITKYKSKLDAVTRQSWLFDLRFKLGKWGGVHGRGWMTNRTGILVLSSGECGQITPFIANAKRPGDDLTLSRPWMRHRQPGIPLRPIVIPRRITTYKVGVGRTRAPAWWFLDEERISKDPRPTIPITSEKSLVVERAPELER